MKLLINFLAVIFLCACASMPSTQYYQLPDAVWNPSFRQTNQMTCIRVITPDILKQDSLLYQTSPTTLSFARHHRWAERLDIAIEQVLANTLNNAVSNKRFIPSSLNISTNSCWQINIQRFQGVYDGKVQVMGTATKINDKQNEVITFNITRNQQGDGYDAMVRALNSALKDVVLEIIR